MTKVDANDMHPMKPYIGLIRGAKITEIEPLLIPIAENRGLKLSKLSDFKKAVKILEDCILYEIWHTGWSNVHWLKYTDVKANRVTISDFNINRKLLADFLRIRSGNIIQIERIEVR